MSQWADNDAVDRAWNMATYGRHFPFGAITPGSGSERCWICGVRDSPTDCHAWVPGPVQACSVEHARMLVYRARVHLRRE